MSLHIGLPLVLQTATELFTHGFQGIKPRGQAFPMNTLFMRLRLELTRNLKSARAESMLKAN
jgi:hypothetical protein